MFPSVLLFLAFFTSVTAPFDPFSLGCGVAGGLIGFVCDGGVAVALPSFDFSFAGPATLFRAGSSFATTSAAAFAVAGPPLTAAGSDEFPDAFGDFKSIKASWVSLRAGEATGAESVCGAAGAPLLGLSNPFPPRAAQSDSSRRAPALARLAASLAK